MFLQHRHFSWFRGRVRIVLLNAIAGIITIAVFFGILQVNPAYSWAWNSYVQNNVDKISLMINAPIDQRMMMKLGPDYRYLMFLRDATPTSAVIYYPTSADFTTPKPGFPAPHFNGRLNDKLTAVRVLYPRRVVTENEYGVTPWSKKITHVAIVNGHNTDKLPYEAPKDYNTGVLPMDSLLFVPL